MKAKIENAGRRSKRKVVEIAARSEKEATLLLALCDDGSVWRCELNTGEPVEWLPLEEVPQD